MRQVVTRVGLCLVSFLVLAAWAVAQSGTTGAISGKVTDPSGATIPGANVVATDTGTNVSHSTVTEANGGYLIPDLVPGTYTVTITRQGFQTEKRTGIILQVAHIADVSVKLPVGASSQTVEVNSQAPLIEPQNPNIATTLSAADISNLPDAGGDISFLATIAPGAMAQRGGDSSVSFNGFAISGTMYVVDGADYDDPALNINLEGPTNISMGINGMSQVTVNTNAYAVDSGRLAGGTVNYFTSSGTNRFHGDAIEQWNGRALNAYDYFVKAVPTAISPLPKKAFDNVNNFANNFGGPILRNKLFFFEDFEGSQIVLPTTPSGVFPSPAWIAYAASQMATGQCDTNSSVAVTAAAPGGSGPGNQCSDPQASGKYVNEKYLPPETGANAPTGVNELPFFQHYMSLFGNTTPGAQSQKQEVAVPIVGCNILPNGTVGSYNPALPYTTANSVLNNNPIPDDAGCGYTTTFSTSNHTWEEYWIQRVDWDRDSKNTIWVESIGDRGVQATSTSVIGPIFNSASNQPDFQGNADWTHVFTPTLTNDFETGFLWYSALFQVADPTAAFAAAPQRLSSPFTTLGGSATSGRLPTQYQFIDNVTWTHGAHNLKIGENWRRELATEYIGTSAQIPAETASTLNELDGGVISTATQSFWIDPDQRYKSWDLDAFAGDTWQLRKNLTLIYGLRVSHYSNELDGPGTQSAAFDWNTVSHSVLTSPTAQFQQDSYFYASVPTLLYQPRMAVTWQLRPNTILKLGYGLFDSVTTTATTLATNPPYDASFTTGFANGNLGANGASAGCTTGVPTPGSGLNQECGVLMDPSQPFSALGAAAFANQTFQSLWAANALSCNAYAPNNPNSATAIPKLSNGLNDCLPQLASFTAEPAQGLHPSPYTEEWSAGLEHQFGNSFALNLEYVGNRTISSPYSYDPNGYETACAGCFSIWPFGSATTSPDPRDAGVTQTELGAFSTYNALQVTATQRLHWGFTYTLNYNYSHCLTTSSSAATSTSLASATWNAGEPLQDLYRDCASDVTNNFSGTYTYHLPFHAQGGFLGGLVNDWQLSGATFSESGQAIFLSGPTNSKLVQTTGPNPAYFVPGVSPYARGQWLTSTSSGVACGTGQTCSGSVPITQPGTYQYFNPTAFASVWDTTNGSCYNYATGAEGLTPALCQLPPAGNAKATLRGPGYNWTNFDVTKTLPLRIINEHTMLRLDASFYNVFNHPNFANPTATGTVNLNQASCTSTTATGAQGFSNCPNSSIVGAGAIKSLVAPPTSLLGLVLGGDDAPRMIAFQGKITF